MKPGANEFILQTTASSLVGSYLLNQLSIQVLEKNGKVDLLCEKWPQSRKLRYSVITEPQSFAFVYPEIASTLWAGFPQSIDLQIFTGSHQLAKVKLYKNVVHLLYWKNDLESRIPIQI